MKRMILLLLVLAACTQSPVPVNPYEGTRGVQLSFAPNAPPDSVLESHSFPVRVIARNSGAADISYDRMLFTFSADPLHFSGGHIQLDPADGDTEGLTRILHGRSLSYPNGESRVYAVPSSGAFKAKRVLGTREQPETELTAGVCYEYNTLLTTTVCIDTNQYRENLRAQVCEQEDLSFSGGQGAPVEITKVEVESYPIVDPVLAEEAVRPSFIIHVRNAADGRVVGPDGLPLQTACLLQDIPREELGAVRVRATLLQAELECTPNPARLFDGEGQTRCTVPVNELTDPTYSVKQNFESVLIVNLSYLYTSGVTKEIAIERVRDPELVGEASSRVPGYHYEGGQPVFDEATGKALTECAYLARAGSDPVVKPGWSCACDFRECTRYSRSDVTDDLSCDLRGTLCPEPTYCCGPVPEEE